MFMQTYFLKLVLNKQQQQQLKLAISGTAEMLSIQSKSIDWEQFSLRIFGKLASACLVTRYAEVASSPTMVHLYHSPVFVEA